MLPMPTFSPPFDPVSSGLPSMRMTGYNYESVKRYLTDISTPNKYSETSVNTYVHDANVDDGAYSGGVYSPSQNRIYFVPRNQGQQANCHYVDCDTGAIVPYTGINAVSGAYIGGVYSPTQNRIYFVPSNQASVSLWHYIDCDDGSVVAYNHMVSVVGQYSGGVYSPLQNRIYFVPRSQASETTWHYIDCSTTTAGVVSVNSYTHGSTTLVGSAYAGGSYSPVQNRIYFTPYNQSDQTTWHYIDCDTTTAGVATIVEYTHGTGITLNGAYNGSSYSPVQNRIYFTPFNISNTADWHYLDCYTEAVVAYTHGATGIINDAYLESVYSPSQNRIYFSPYAQASETNWHYIDCDDGSVVSYTPGSTFENRPYTGGSYSPTQNRIYLSPSRTQSSFASWHYLKPLTAANASISFSASTLIGN
jgi:hypothetical protein